MDAKLTPDDYDDPALEGQWCDDRRAEVIAYLLRENVAHGRVGEWPGWHLAPYVSIWAIESLARPDWVGWWVICGDLPTDYVSASTIKHPREAMKAIAERWSGLAEKMSSGEEHPEMVIGPPEKWPELAPLLAARAKILCGYVNDNVCWDD